MKKFVISICAIMALFSLALPTNAAMMPFTAEAVMTQGPNAKGPDFSEILQLFVPDGWKYSKSKYSVNLESGKSRKLWIKVEAGDFGKMNPKAVLLSVMDEGIPFSNGVPAPEKEKKVADVTDYAENCRSWSVVTGRGGEKVKHLFIASAERGHYVHFFWSEMCDKEAMEVINASLLYGEKIAEKLQGK